MVGVGESENPREGWPAFRPAQVAFPVSAEGFQLSRPAAGTRQAGCNRSPIGEFPIRLPWGAKSRGQPLHLRTAAGWLVGQFAWVRSVGMPLRGVRGYRFRMLVLFSVPGTQY